MAICKGCKEEIQWSEYQEKGLTKYKALNAIDGSPHKCAAYSKPDEPKPEKPEPPKEPTWYRVTLATYNWSMIIFRFETGQKNKSQAGITDAQFQRLEREVPKERLPLENVLVAFDNAGMVIGLDLSKAKPGVEKEDLAQNLPVKEVEPDRMRGPADGECVSPPGEIIKTPGQPPPEPEQKEPEKICTCTSPHTQARMWSGETRLSIGVTVNLENYENLRVEVSGAAADRDQLIDYLDETLGKFGKTAETKDKIAAYQRRVIG